MYVGHSKKVFFIVNVHILFICIVLVDYDTIKSLFILPFTKKNIMWIPYIKFFLGIKENMGVGFDPNICR